MNPAAAPLEAPAEIKPPPPPRMTSLVGGIKNNIAPPSQGVVSVAPPPPPPPPAKPIRVGGNVQAPERIKYVPPVYPRIAQAAKVQGIVIIEATISKTGDVVDARILRSTPMLDQAALDAVKEWKYSPPLLNEQPVDVLMTVTVNFTLN